MTQPSTHPDDREPLGDDATGPLDRDELLAAWDKARSAPTPAYTDDDIRRGHRMRRGVQ